MSDIENQNTGISAAVDLALADALDDADGDDLGWSGQQLSLLPTDSLEIAAERGRGRPPGSQNKNTMEWARYIAARYTNPLIFLAETYCRPVKELAKELGCSKEKAFSFQQAAAMKMTEFTNQKMPTTVDLGVDGDVMLTINTTYQRPDSQPGDDAQDLGAVSFAIPIIENQSD